MLGLSKKTGPSSAPVDSAAHDDHTGANARAATGQASQAAIARMTQGAHKFADGGGGDAGTDAQQGDTTQQGAAGLPSVGDSGMLTADLATKIDGKDATVPKGTVLEVVTAAPDNLVCKVWGQFGGKQATVPTASFKAEPGLTHKEEAGHTDEPDNYSYQPYAGVLWNGQPHASDVAQGYIGDCYLISAMGAVAAANPQAIMKLFAPNKPGQTSYTISLYLRDGNGGFQKQSVTVDTNLPSQLDAAQKQAPVYGQLGKDLDDNQTPMWPALLEKAYAQLMGGYDQVGNGGYPERAMEAFTGVASQAEDVPQQAGDILTKFKEFQKAGKAVVCGTLDSKQASSKTGFQGSADGPYSMMLTGDNNDQVELVKGSLVISDVKGKAPQVSDDGNGNMVGAKGTVSYGWGATPNFTYDQGKGPAAATDLSANYQWRGQLDKSLDVYANHAYMFESVTSDDKLVFKNPWGVEHPQPMSADDFKRLFIGIDSNGVPKVPDQPSNKDAKSA